MTLSLLSEGVGDRSFPGNFAHIRGIATEGGIRNKSEPKVITV